MGDSARELQGIVAIERLAADVAKSKLKAGSMAAGDGDSCGAGELADLLSCRFQGRTGFRESTLQDERR